MRYLDDNDEIVRWSSEEMYVPYRKPTTKKLHRYFPDMIFTNVHGETYMIEIKPHSQTKMPTFSGKSSKPTKRFMREAVEYAINEAKWEAAKEYCRKRGWKFDIVTEKDLT